MGKKPVKPTAKAASSSKGAAAKSKAGSKKQRDTSSSSSYGSLHDPLDRQLALLGLRVRNITADGNCFFRALSDQLQGDESRHSELRGQVVSLMRDQADGFAPFVEDDMSLDDHLGRMKKEGVWAGHMELQAASLLLQVNIAIYQAGQPRWCITNFPTGSPMLHLSYHDGEHYNSVRRADDYSRGNPADIPETLQPVADLGQARHCWSAADEQRVAEGTGCDNPVLIRQQLEKAGGNVDTAIEAVIEVMAGDDYEDGTAAAAATDAAAAAAVDAGSGVEGAGSYSGDNRASAADAQGAEAPAAAAPAAAAVVSSTVAACSSDGAQVEGQTAPAAPAEQEQVQQLLSETSSSHSLAASLEHDQQKGSSSSKTLEASPGGPAATSQPSSDAPQAPAATAAAAAAAAEVTPPEAATDGGSVGVGHGSNKKQKGLKGHKLKGSSSSAAAAAVGSSRRGGDKAPSRNKPCPCGSGRKHKVCCGKAAVAVQEVDPPAYKLPKSVTWADEEGPGVLTHTLHI